YAALRQRVNDLEKEGARARRQDQRAEALASLGRLRPGAVIRVPAGKVAGWAVVVDPDAHSEEPRPLVVTDERHAKRLNITDFPTPVESVARVRVPRNFSPRNPALRRDLASAVRAK